MAVVTGDRTSYFLEEIKSQWQATIAARCEALLAGDTWLAELLSGRLDDLRDLVRHNGFVGLIPAKSAA
jgi:hypothetical protein